MTSTSVAAANKILNGRRLELVGSVLFRPFRNLWMLEELGLPYDYIPARPRGRAVSQHHELGKVPVLLEYAEGSDSSPFTMYESAAINTYLGDMVNCANDRRHHYTLKEAMDGPKPGEERIDSLVPRVGTPERGRYEQTVSCILTELDAQGLWIHRKHEALGQFFGTIPEAVAHAKSHFDRINAHLSKQINDNPHSHYLVGHSFTAADILYVHCLDWSKSIQWDDEWKDNEILLEYLKLCKSRSAYQRVAEMRKRETEQEKAAESKAKEEKSASNNPQSKI